MSENARVLSIQSHVVSGYVGNKCAVFPLQLLGFEVDPINSVQFSNRAGPGYEKVTGQTLSQQDLSDLVEGLKANKLDNYTHVLTGYIGSKSFLEGISSLIRYLKTVNPNLVYVCDPVMGDHGTLYVPENLLPVYINSVLPVADVITPNQYEVELLTQVKISTINDIWKAVDILHGKGVRTVVVSSAELEGEDQLLIVASSRSDNKKVVLKVDKLPATFVGTGDIFSALLLAWMHKTNNDIKEALEKTTSTLQAVLQRTMNSAEGDISGKLLELKILQSKTDIENPQMPVTGQYVE